MVVGVSERTKGAALAVVGAGLLGLTLGATEFHASWSIPVGVISVVAAGAAVIGVATLARPVAAETGQGDLAWPLNRIIRTSLAIAVALAAVAVLAASHRYEDLQRCETTTAEPVVETTSEGNSTTVKTTDADDDGAVTTTVCQPIEPLVLAPVVLVVALLLLPDLAKLAIGDLITLEFKEVKEAAESAKEEAKAAKEAVNTLMASVDQVTVAQQQVGSSIENAVRQSVQLSFEGIAEVLRASTEPVRAIEWRTSVIARWKAVRDRKLWDDSNAYDEARRIADYAEGLIPLTEDQYRSFLDLVREPAARFAEERSGAGLVSGAELLEQLGREGER